MAQEVRGVTVIPVVDTIVPGDTLPHNLPERRLRLRSQLSLELAEGQWDPERPVDTPAGLNDPAASREALAEAARSLGDDGFALGIPWGEVHRVIRGGVDVPVSGCPPTLGCFRVVSYEERDDGRRAANRGDSWVLLVEFEDVPRAYTVLAYGQTARTESPHFADQAVMFARGELKAVAWTEEGIARETISRYRPGEEVRR